MKVTKTAEGFELIPDTKDELERLRWLIECLRAHPDNRVVEVGSRPRLDFDQLLSSSETLILDMIQRNATEIRRSLDLEGAWSS